MSPSSGIAATEIVIRLREQLKQHWRAGSRLRVEDLLEQWPSAALDEEALLDLIYQEIVTREEAGETPVLHEYQQRFAHLAVQLERQLALHRVLKNDVAPSTCGPTMAAEIASTVGTLSVGGTIGQYALEAELGRGGMGVVFKALDSRLQRAVALKLILGQDHATVDQVKRFRAEAGILAQLQHPNIVQIFEIGEHQGAVFFAMEYIAGQTLQQRVRESPLDPATAARLVALLAEAMQVAHERGIIHRDLKPSNVLLGDGLNPKITDFGLARHGQSELTVTGAILGTPSYMAPEQALGQLDRIGPAADVYALGAILFELLTGRAPFRSASVHATLHQVINDEPPAPRRLQPGISRDLETICLKCLHKDAGRRYASARELAEDLQRYLRGEPIRARPIGRLQTLVKWVRREPKVAGLAAVIFLIVLVSFCIVVWLWQAERQERQNTQEQLYVNAISLANRELAAHKVPWAERALAKCPTVLRGWEWHHLMYRCRHGDTPPRLTPGAVSSVAVSGTRVAVGCSDGQMAFFDGDRMSQPYFLGHLGSVNWLAFSSDGSEVFSGGEDGRICGWNIVGGGKTMTFAEHQGPIACLAVHPQQPWIASTTFSGSDAGVVVLWDRRTLEPLWTSKNHTACVASLAFHPGGKLLASASHDRTITILDCQSGQIVHVLREHRLPIACAAFSPDGGLLASSAGRAQAARPDEDEIFVWDWAANSVRHHLRGHAKRAVALAFAPEGKRLATAGWDHQIKLWDMRTGDEILTLDGHTDGIMALAFDQENTLYTGSLDRSMRIWKAERQD